MRSDAGVLAYPWYSLSTRKMNKAVSITFFFFKRGKVQNKSQTIKGVLPLHLRTTSILAVWKELDLEF